MEEREDCTDLWSDKMNLKKRTKDGRIVSQCYDEDQFSDGQISNEKWRNPFLGVLGSISIDFDLIISQFGIIFSMLLSLLK